MVIQMDKSNIELFFDGQEIGFINDELKIDKVQKVKQPPFSKNFKGTLENVEFSEEFLRYIEKQRRILKIQKARENLYKYMD